MKTKIHQPCSEKWESPTQTNIPQWSLAAALASFLANPNITLDSPSPLQEMPLSETEQEIFGEPKQDRNESPVVAIDTVIISGEIIALDNQCAVFGVIVEVMGTNIRTSSDENGCFKIVVPASEKNIVLSCFSIAYEVSNVEVLPFRNISNIVIKLEASQQKLRAL